MTKPAYKTTVLQNLGEHDAFIRILKDECVRSYLEIGLGKGGSFWRVGNSLPDGSRLVGLSLHSQQSSAVSCQEAIESFRRRGYDAHLIGGNSVDGDVIRQAEALAPFDCVFIDGDHSLAGVTADWKNYGPLGRIVAFHDISWNETYVSKVPGRVIQPMGVPQLWNELKLHHRHSEIRFQKHGNYYGIGVLWSGQEGDRAARMRT